MTGNGLESLRKKTPHLNSFRAIKSNRTCFVPQKQLTLPCLTGKMKIAMSSATHVVLMTVNYSHDIATALLAASGAAMWLLSKNYPADADLAVERYFIRTYRSITRVAKDSLSYILIAGVPRVVFYMRYEWSDLAGNMQIVAVVIKHIVMFLLVGTGVYYWIKLDRRVKTLKLQHQDF